MPSTVNIGVFVGAWKDMEKAVKMGKVRALGISNSLADDEMQQMRPLDKEQRFFNATLEDVEKMVWGSLTHLCCGIYGM